MHACMQWMLALAIALALLSTFVCDLGLIRQLSLTRLHARG